MVFVVICFGNLVIVIIMFIIRNLLLLKILNGKEVEDLGLNFIIVDDNFGIRKVRGFFYMFFKM